MARLIPLVRDGGFYASNAWTPLVMDGGYTQGGGEPEPKWEYKYVAGMSPLLLAAALGKPLKSLTQYGLCSQADTPTPSAPQDILCNNGTLKMVDDELPIGYKRLTGIRFDGDTWYETGEALTGDDDVTMTLDNTLSSGKNVFGSYNGANTKNFSLYLYGGDASSGSYFRYGGQLKRPVYGDGKRTITFGKSGTQGFETDTDVTPDDFTTPANTYIGMLPNSSSPAYVGDIVGSILVSNRLEWIPCERETDGVIGYYEKYKGNFIAPSGSGTPVSLGYDGSHYHLNVVGTDEILSLYHNARDAHYVQYLNAYIKAATRQISAYNGNSVVTFDCEIGQTYRCFDLAAAGNASSVNVGFSDTIPGIGYTYSADDFVSIAVAGGYRANGLVFTATKRYATFIFRYDGDSAKTPESMLEQMLFAEVAQTQTATVPMLLSVGDYADEVEIISGGVKRKVGIKVFDGTESFGKSSAYGAAFYIQSAAGSWGAQKARVMCSHYLGLDAASSSTAVGTCFFNASGHFYFRVADNSDTAAFKAWLAEQYAAGTPVIVIYPLATETTESVTPQPMNTADGDNVISVTAEVSPIQLSAEYAILSEAG